MKKSPLVLAAALWIGACNYAADTADTNGAAVVSQEGEAKEKAKGAKTTEGKKTEADKGEMKKGGTKALEEMRAFIAKQTIEKDQQGWKTALPKPPKADFTGDGTYYWLLETNKGPVRVKLMPEVAPMHVSSTIYLTELGFYDDITFHRVIPGFMAQGGCPLGKGFGSPGYKYEGEFSKDVRHDSPGILSMANAGPGTDGSQFFLTFTPTPHLDGKHTIFGKAINAEKTLKALEAAGSRSGRTTEPLMIKKATIVVE